MSAFIRKYGMTATDMTRRNAEQVQAMKRRQQAHDTALERPGMLDIKGQVYPVTRMQSLIHAWHYSH